MGLLPRSARVNGDLFFEKRNLALLNDADMSALRGASISMIFQEPMTALNPLQTIENQIAEVFLTHQSLTADDARGKAHDLLERVGMAPSTLSPERYPHELSGGQRQRVIIAMALALKPSIVMADEPTTALDASTQRDILELLKSLCVDDNIALMLITHDLAVVADIADDIAVIQKGRIIEQAPKTDIAKKVSEGAYSELMGARQATPQTTPPRSQRRPVLRVSDLSCAYPKHASGLYFKKERFLAVKDVSLAVEAGECLGIVGESGSGKSTLARALVGLESLAAGEIEIDGASVNVKRKTDMLRLWRQIQIVFQDPYSSFNPRHTVAQIVSEPLHLLGQTLTAAARRERVTDALESVGLKAEHAARSPDAFSGGQRQRIALARALIINPSLIILDEATSALDSAARNRVLSLLSDLRVSRGVSLLFISHDLAVIRGVANRIAVMKSGEIIETGATEEIFSHPRHDYTRKLVAAAEELAAALDNLRSGAL